MSGDRLGNLAQYDRRGNALRQRYVYFAVIGKYLKVGFSVNPRQRVATLRHASTLWRPADLSYTDPAVLLHAVRGGPDEEAEAHVALCEFHVGGEWFLAEPEATEVIPAAFRSDEPFPHVTRSAGAFRADLRDIYPPSQTPTDEGNPRPLSVA